MGMMFRSFSRSATGLLLFLCGGLPVLSSCHEQGGEAGTPAEHPALRATAPAPEGPVLERAYRYDHLSDVCRYVLYFHRTRRSPEDTDDEWRLAVYDARTGALRDSFTQRCTGPLFYDTVPTPGHVRSFITGVNQEKEALDNDYGDLVVADLNFDGREDVALKTNEGGTSGSYYTYFLQGGTGRFEKSDYLTDSVSLFPGTIDARRKRLITFGHAGACGVGEHRYRYHPATRSYRKEAYRYHDICK
ncbi:XAC2610-related protein [Flaviaesturariibacter amylovorans]|uniref:VCBS repeat-containing protein n=1 Tax=Flaviaesturariibacter amylovorans TaxID=1084520 RepID=A0ABP8GIN9_9BACT